MTLWGIRKPDGSVYRDLASNSPKESIERMLCEPGETVVPVVAVEPAELEALKAPAEDAERLVWAMCNRLVRRHQVDLGVRGPPYWRWSNWYLAHDMGGFDLGGEDIPVLTNEARAAIDKARGEA